MEIALLIQDDAVRTRKGHADHPGIDVGRDHEVNARRAHIPMSFCFSCAYPMENFLHGQGRSQRMTMEACGLFDKKSPVNQ